MFSIIYYKREYRISPIIMQWHHAIHYVWYCNIHPYRDSIRIFLSNLFSFTSSLLEAIFFLVLPTHYYDHFAELFQINAVVNLFIYIRNKQYVIRILPVFRSVCKHAVLRELLRPGSNLPNLWFLADARAYATVLRPSSVWNVCRLLWLNGAS